MLSGVINQRVACECSDSIIQRNIEVDLYLNISDTCLHFNFEKLYDENKNVKDDVTVGPKEYEELLSNFDKIDTLTKRLVLALSSKTPDPEVKTQPSQELYYKASAKYFSEILSNPSKLIENQVKYYKSTLESWTNIQNDLLKNADTPHNQN